MTSHSAALELRRQFSLPYAGRTDAVTLKEIEERMHKARKWCSRRTGGVLNWQLMIERDGMPPPISRVGAPTFERNLMEAWFKRNDPAKPKPAANDAAPVTRNTADEWDRALEHEYARPKESA
jgi:hypothetical protein